MEGAVSLSIIAVANAPGAQLDNFLARLASIIQSIPDAEILVFTSGPASLAAGDAEFWRTRHIAERCPEGFLRNMALGAARGKYVLFVDPAREFEDSFLETAAVETDAADIIVFGCDREKDGFAEYCGPDAGELNSTRALAWLMESSLGHLGKMYNLAALRAWNLQFADELDGPDAGFAARAILAASSIKAVQESACLMPAEAEIGRSARDEARAVAELFAALAEYPENDLAIVKFSLARLLAERLLPACRDAAAAAIVAEACSGNALLADAVMKQGIGSRGQEKVPGAKRAWRPDMASEPLLSVIVPVYNQENWLGRCLDSILAQSLRGIEVIVINDASTDGTLAVCKDYARRDARVRLLNMKRNRGQGYCRNVAIGASRGRFVTFVDSDDYILPGFLLSAAAQLSRNPHVDYIQFGKALPDGSVYSLYSSRREITGRQMAELYLAEKMEYWECWGKVYRRDFLARENLRFARHLFEDEIFLLEAYSAAGKLIIDPRPAYVYERRTHLASAMAPTQWTHRHLAGFLARCAEVDDFLARHPELDADGLQAYRKLAKVYEYFRPLVAGYVASQAKNGAHVPDNADMAHLAASPSFIRILLEDYATLRADAADARGGIDAAHNLRHGQRNYSGWEFVCAHAARDAAAPAISFLVAARDAGEGLKERLESLAEQSGAEVLVIDAQSRDETAAICAELACEYDNFAWFRAARSIPDGALYQLALAFARGEYVACFDGTEFLAPGAARQWLTAMGGARQAIWHLGMLPESDDVAPASLDAGAEALLGLLANARQWRLGQWLFARDFLLAQEAPFPPAFGCEYGMLPRILLVGADVRELAGVARPQRLRSRQRLSAGLEEKAISLLANAEYALGAANRLADAETGRFFAQKWLNAVCGAANLQFWLLDYVRTRKAPGQRLEKEICLRVAAMPDLLRWLFLEYGRAWEKGGAAA